MKKYFKTSKILRNEFKVTKVLYSKEKKKRKTNWPIQVNAW